jgi:octaprenyl-diphosphate synthase
VEVEDAQALYSPTGRARARLEELEKALKDFIDSYSWSRMHEPLLYALKQGKRVRPLTLLLCHDLFSKNDIDPLLAAIAVELLHTESVIHDDIIDDSASRRGEPAFHVRYGYGASMLSADFVFGVILDISANYSDPRVTRELSSAALNMCEGEYGELLIDSNTHPLRMDEYLQLVTRKTASLFSTAAKIGTILGGGDAHMENMAQFGLNLGIAFQISDDLIDWGSHDNVTRAFSNSMGSRNARMKLQDEALRYANLGKKNLESLPNVEARQSLLDLLAYVDSRSC